MIFKLYRIGEDFSEFGNWDEFRGKVIRAPSEDVARKHANATCGDEGKIWEDPKQVSSENLSGYGRVETLLSDYHTA